jgi:hypothetical protein
MLKPALYYISNGLSVIPCKDKIPAVKSWKEYQSKIMSADDAPNYFNNNTAEIAVIAGIVSGGLEIIDFDIKHLAPLEQEAFWTTFQNELLELSADLVRKIQINKTRTGGYHILYRCEEIEGNKKLAKVKVKDKYECLIETRGEGGYVIAPPSPGYSFIQGDMSTIPFIDVDERFMLISLCKSFDQEPEHITFKKSNTQFNNNAFKKSPFDDYNQSEDVLTLLTAHGWKAVQDVGAKIFFRRPGSENFQSANWHKEKKIFYVFSSGDQFLEGGKGYNSSQIYCILEHGGDWKECYKALLSNGYGDRWSDDERTAMDMARSKVAANTDIVKIKHDIRKEWPKWMEADIDRIIEVASSMVNEGEFWFVNNKGIISINTLEYINFLHNTLGYALHGDSVEVKKPLIKIDKSLHQVEKIHTNDAVKRDVTKWLHDNIVPEEHRVTPDEVLSALINKDTKLFSENTYEWLPAISFITFKDTVDFAYFFFRNGIVKVSADKIELTPYNDLPDNTFIWKERIRCKDFDISIIDDLDADPYLSPKYKYNVSDKQSHGSSWYKFIRRISGLGPEMDNLSIEELGENKETEDKKDRLLSTMTMIGYLLHSFKDKSKPWAIVVQEDTPIDGMGGGSGKQIIYNGIKMLRNVLEEDGKQLDVTKQFAFQGVSEDLDLYVLDDVKKYFKLEIMYRMITNDMVIEQRNIGRKTITYEDSPKFMITTNYDLTGSDNAKHLARRIKIMLVDCYFGPNRSPVDELGMLLTDKWDNGQWQLFYNFMFRCTSVYLNWSVIDIDVTDNMNEKAIRQAFSDDFFEFMKSLVMEKSTEWMVASSIHDQFCDEYKVDKRSFNYAKFRKGFEAFCDRFKIKYDTDKNFRDLSFEAVEKWGKRIDKQLAYIFLHENPL